MSKIFVFGTLTAHNFDLMAEKYAIEDMQACMIIQVGTRWFECWLTKPPWYAEKAHNKNVIMNIRRPNRREISVIGKNQSITELSIQSMIRNHSKRLSHPYFLINNTVVSQMEKWRANMVIRTQNWPSDQELWPTDRGWLSTFHGPCEIKWFESVFDKV